MDLLEAIKARHSVGSYTDKSIEKLSTIGAVEYVPAWFLAGMKAVQLAPGAMNHQNTYLNWMGI